MSDAKVTSNDGLQVNDSKVTSGDRLQKKKILFTASTMSHIENFHLPYLEEFRKMGWEVKAVALPISKSFFSFKNLSAIRFTKKLLQDERFDVVTSHATLAGIVTRLGVMLAGKKNLKIKVFHTSHGYLFHDDNSLKKWAYLLPEMLCGTVTDVLMVMNHEDLDIAQKYRLCGKSNQIHYINGMGIDLSKFTTERASAEQRAKFGIDPDDFAFVYAAEFSKRKNHELLLKGFAKAIDTLKSAERKQELEVSASVSEALVDNQPENRLKDSHSTSDHLKLVLAGDGALFEEMKSLAASLDISDHVIFLGYNRNMAELYPCCDAAVSTSRIEGLPFNIMEAMACGLPIVASNIKGHQELVTHGENGLLFESGDVDGLADGLTKLFQNAEFKQRFIIITLEKIKQFSLENVLPNIIRNYYEQVL